MKPFKDIEKEMRAYEIGPLEKLAVQDAVIIIAVYAAQIDPQNSEEDIKRIEALAEQCPLCVERKEGILSRINRFVNLLRTIDSEKAIEAVIKVLDPESRKEAFKLAAEVVISGDKPPIKKREILDKLARKLSVDNQFAEKIINKE
ncbi:MAG: hypothetical protein JRH18_06500 [Deltaproteobacteria bacterium]|nr:hypothetical protein [Deltaproteobacteria bacterium]MBW1962261.1 hypothetical protein [Deltaproteobacteria bacterium]MBW1995925.1 hypothetical protein [Deltaproteobacteria bacterium]MBW2151303.1 hypothetical protein [Deltaproteobacteria bacterium]